MHFGLQTTPFCFISVTRLCTSVYLSSQNGGLTYKLVACWVNSLQSNRNRTIIVLRHWDFICTGTPTHGRNGSLAQNKCLYFPAHHERMENTTPTKPYKHLPQACSYLIHKPCVHRAAGSTVPLDFLWKVSFLVTLTLFRYTSVLKHLAYFHYC